MEIGEKNEEDKGPLAKGVLQASGDRRDGSERTNQILI